MASEAKRGCGYRKVGGLYLVSGKLGVPCCKMPIPLCICPACGQGIKQARGWTWVSPTLLFGIGGCIEDRGTICPAANPTLLGERAGLLWIGKAFYKTPDEFQAEAATLGVSRRIASVPRGFEVGKTWVLFAHPEAVQTDEGKKAGIFRIFLPERIEKIVKQSDYDRARNAYNVRAEEAYAPQPWEPETDELKKLLDSYDSDRKRGITWVREQRHEHGKLVEAA